MAKEIFAHSIICIIMVNLILQKFAPFLFYSKMNEKKHHLVLAQIFQK